MQEPTQRFAEDTVPALHRVQLLRGFPQPGKEPGNPHIGRAARHAICRCIPAPVRSFTIPRSGRLESAITADRVYELVRAYSAQLGGSRAALMRFPTVAHQGSTTRPTLPTCRNGLVTVLGAVKDRFAPVSGGPKQRALFQDFRASVSNRGKTPGRTGQVRRAGCGSG